MSEPQILYVDDQQSHRALFQKAFESGYFVQTAGSGAEGLDLIRKNDFFLIIADHNMPQMTGIDFLEQVVTLKPKAIQAILSAYENEEIIREANRRTKIAQYLTKPWKWDRMRTFIEDSYKMYESVNPGSLPEILPAEKQIVTPTRSVSWNALAELMAQIDGRVDTRGKKRIFLSYVEPKLRAYVPPIRRPIPELVALAQQEALRGNFDGMQEILAAYLRQSREPTAEEATPEPIEKALARALAN